MSQHNRGYRIARVWLRRNPFKGLSIVGVGAFLLGLGVYEFLNQFDWGKVVITLIFTMFTSEGSIAKMVADGKLFGVIITYVICADILSILFDLFIVNRLLSWEFFKSRIDWTNRHLKRLAQKIGSFWKMIINVFPWVKSVNNLPYNGFSRSLDYFRNHLDGIRKNPTKAGYGAIIFCGLMPRIPFMFLGGVSLGIFIIRYNNFGFRVWLALISAIIVRTSIWLGSLYGLISIF